MSNHDDDDEPNWWDKLTIPHALLIGLVILLVFGGVHCSIDVKSATSSEQQK